MSSPVQSSEHTRFQIIRSAGDLFHRGGVRFTTTDEIVEAAGVTKAEFLQCFRCKQELVDSVFRFYLENIAAATNSINFEVDSWSDLEDCLASKVDFQRKFRMTRGCPMGVLGSELREEEESTRHFLSLVLDLWMTRLECFFGREKMAGRLASNVDVEQLANFCVVIIQGAMLSGKIRRNCLCVESIFEDLLGHLKHYVKIPRAPRRRPDRDRHPKLLSGLPKALVPKTAVESHDSQNPGDSVEDYPIGQCRPEDKV
jgi:TetR/AcrR family transcriptional regulator, transcriptional repressor for nem operon